MASKYPEMNWSAGDAAEEFKLFKQRMQLSLTDNGITDKAKQSVKIRLAVGTDGLRKINASGLSEGDEKDPDKLWKLFEYQLNLHVNFRIHRMELMRFRQKPEESIDEFVNRCRTKARECDFEEGELAERIIELVIASTKIEQLQKALLDNEKGFTIKDLLTEARKFEAIDADKKHLKDLDTTCKTEVGSITAKKPCRKCERKHPPKSCPAYTRQKETCCSTWWQAPIKEP